MPLTIVLNETGGAELLRVADNPAGEPGEGEVLLRHTAIGVNYIDIYHRTGVYPVPSFPAILGVEGVGVVEAVGKGVAGVRKGERYAYAGGPIGAYQAYRVIPARYLVPVPDGVDDVVIAASMLKGLTAYMLLHKTWKGSSGKYVLFHAAAGGVGLMFCQMAKAMGIRVIGTAGSAEKAALARQHGCRYTIEYRRENVVEAVKRYTDGEGVDAVFDSVGRDTFMDSLDCLKRFGLMVCFGQSSGSIPPFDIQLLQQKGSLYLTRPTLLHHVEDRTAYLAFARELFSLMKERKVIPYIGRVLPLAQAAQAHALLEARETRGSIVLTV